MGEEGRRYPDVAIAQHVQSKGQQVDEVLEGEVQQALTKLSDVAPALPWRSDAPHAMAAGHMTAVSLLQQVRPLPSPLSASSDRFASSSCTVTVDTSGSHMAPEELFSGKHPNTCAAYAPTTTCSSGLTRSPLCMCRAQIKTGFGGGGGKAKVKGKGKGKGKRAK